MAIVQNIACASCQETGHDQRGSNMMVFEDGAMYCNRAHWHKDGMPLYIAPDGKNPILDKEIDGTVKYTVDQFNALKEEGKLINPMVRAIALSGMRGEDQWSVSTDEEREAMLKERSEDESYFNKLKIKSLVSRHIPGQIAKFYDVRVGLGLDGKVARHYYPTFDLKGNWKGAKCRTLPKDFKYGHLGWTWGDNLMFGQKQTQAVLATGARMDTLLLVGGECDAMAAQVMLLASKEGTKWEGVYSHVWSVTKGERDVEEIILNKEAIKKFKKIIVCFDDDETGRLMNKNVGKIFRGKTYKLNLPEGCNDPNDCLKQGRGDEFVEAWWNPVDVFEGGSLSSMNKYREEAKVMPTMGVSWPFPTMNPVTFGMRENYLSVWGMGTGVGKTKMTKEVVFHLAYEHNQNVVVIYLEEQAKKTVRSFAGTMINKDLTGPPINDKDDPEYSLMRDYTEEEANQAIDDLCDDGRIMIGDLKGSKEVDAVMEVMEEALALGFKWFIIDNLTAFQHKGKGGTDTNSTDAIDETMRRIGTFKDENPVFILLLSHLKKVYGDRTPHEEGGPVGLRDFRGAGSITFWANDVWGGRRNTLAPSFEEKCLTVYENLKNRDVGYKTGSQVYVKMGMSDGRLRETMDRPTEFDDGTTPKREKKKKETPSTNDY